MREMILIEYNNVIFSESAASLFQHEQLTVYKTGTFKPLFSILIDLIGILNQWTTASFINFFFTDLYPLKYHKAEKHPCSRSWGIFVQQFQFCHLFKFIALQCSRISQEEKSTDRPLVPLEWYDKLSHLVSIEIIFQQYIILFYNDFSYIFPYDIPNIGLNNSPQKNCPLFETF